MTSHFGSLHYGLLPCHDRPLRTSYLHRKWALPDKQMRISSYVMAFSLKQTNQQVSRRQNLSTISLGDLLHQRGRWLRGRGVLRGNGRLPRGGALRARGDLLESGSCQSLYLFVKLLVM